MNTEVPSQNSKHVFTGLNKSAVTEKVKKLASFLLLPPSDRSTYQTHQISQHLEEYQFFSRYASSGILFELIKHLKLESYAIGTVLIPWTSTESNLYLILSGRIGQYKKEEKGFEEVREYSIGACFGENGILGELAHEEYRALEAAQLMVLEKSIFEVVISNIQKERFDEQYSFFKSIPLLEKLKNSTLEHFARIALTKRFAPNTLLAKQGERPRGFYIIQSGSAKLLRNMLVPQAGEVSARIVEIDEVETGGVLCEYAFINQEPLEYSVLCTMPLIAYFLDKDEFRGQAQRFLNDFSNVASKIPGDEELSQRFLQRRDWNKFKSRFLKEIEVGKRRKAAIQSVRCHENVKLPSLKRVRNLSL